MEKMVQRSDRPSLRSRFDRRFCSIRWNAVFPERVPDSEMDQGLDAGENDGTTRGGVAGGDSHDHHREYSGYCHQEQANSP